MPQPLTVQQAIEFLAATITAEAERENLPLLVVEQKMLYFSETVPTLPDIAEVSLAFDRDYDQAAYEDKIANLIRHFLTRATASDSQSLSDWNSAVATLRKQDVYILVLIGLAEGSLRPINQSNPESPGWRIKYVAIGLAIGTVIVVLLFAFAMLRRG